MSLALAGVLIGLACKKDTRTGDPEPLVPDADLVVRVVAPGVKLAELEQRIAIPLEQALAGLEQVATVDVLVEEGQVELLLRVQPGVDAEPIAAAVTARLRAAPGPRPAAASPPSVTFAPRSTTVSRFHSTVEDPAPLPVPRLGRVRTCGPTLERVARLDPARLVATAVSLDDVVAAFERPAADVAATPLPGGHRLGEVAQISVEDRSRCRVVAGGFSHVASVHRPAEVELDLGMAAQRGWRPVIAPSGQVELVVGFDGDGPEVLRDLTDSLRGNHAAIALEELGPAHVGRIIFAPSWDTRVRDTARAAVARVPGTRLLEVVEGSDDRVEAVVTGPDRLALITRARAALPELAKPDPDGFTGCIGCDLRAQVELRLAESAPPGADRAAAALGARGLTLRAPDGAPLHVLLASGEELSTQAVSDVPLRGRAGQLVPLSSMGELTVSDQPVVLLRHQGQPAIIVWMRPWSIGSHDAKAALERAFPGATVRITYPGLW